MDGDDVGYNFRHEVAVRRSRDSICRADGNFELVYELTPKKGEQGTFTVPVEGDLTMTDIQQIQSIRSQTLAQLDSLRADPEADVLARRPAGALAGVRGVARADDRLVRSQAGRVRAV